MKTVETIAISSRGEFEEAVLAVLAGARRELVCYDPSLADWPLERRDASELLAAFIARDPAATLRLMVVDTGWLERFAPRMTSLRRRFDARILCRRVPRELAPAEGVLIADGEQLLRRTHPDHHRARLMFAADPRRDALVAKYRALWDESEPCLTSTTLGL